MKTQGHHPNESAYRDGYVNGKIEAEREQGYNEQIRAENQRMRESTSTANGLMLGGLLAALLGFGVATYFIVSQSNQSTTTPENPVSQPQVDKETTIIERSVDRVQETVPTTPPDINVNVPAPEQPIDSQVQEFTEGAKEALPDPNQLKEALPNPDGASPES